MKDKSCNSDIYVYEEGKEPYLFISYSHADNEIVKSILARLSEEKFRFWYDAAMGKEGEKNFIVNMEKKIKDSVGIILFVSESSMSSEYCGQELLMGYRFGKEVHPVNVSDKEIKDVVPHILESFLSKNVHIPKILNIDEDIDGFNTLCKFLPDAARHCIETDKDDCTVISKCKDGSKSINIGDEIKTIGSRAFYDCKQLQNIVFNNVTLIDDEAFLGCERLKAINFPASVARIGEYSFKDCESVTSICFDNPNCLIGESAFDGCINLKHINLPKDLSEISSGMFNGCAELENLIMPDNIITIGESAFEGCKKIRFDCNKLPETLKKIDDRAFADCNSIVNITLPDGLKKLGKNVFKDCVNLKNVDIGKHLASIGSNPFRGCHSLERISVVADNKFFKSADNVLFNKNRSVLICYPSCNINGKQKYDIPDSVISIGDWAFSECNSLTDINIPDSVDEIGENAFYKCRGLKKVFIPDGVDKIDDMAFRGCTNLKEILIPPSVINIGWAIFSGCENVKIICQEHSAIANFYNNTKNSNSDIVSCQVFSEEEFDSVYREFINAD